LNIAVVPSLWPFEVANALAIAERRNSVNPDQVAEFLERLRCLPIHVERRDATWVCQATLRLARELRVSAYDAAYLVLAMRERLSLATLDDQLQQAAITIGVPAFDARY